MPAAAGVEEVAALEESDGRPASRFHRLMWLVPASLLLPGLVITIAVGFLELVR